MPFVSPLLKCRCPFCGITFHPGECAIVAKQNRTVLYTPQIAVGNAKKIFTRSWLEPLNKPEYFQQLAARQCPQCGELLPPNIENTSSVTIAIIGDTFSGKSHYIAAAVHQLKETFLQSSDRYMRFVSLSHDVEEQYQQDYFKPLFEMKQPLNQTKQAATPINKPLIYELVMQTSAATDYVRRANMLIYDASGEDIANQDRLVQFKQYILHADAIIFLADPWSMPGIVNQLPYHLRPDPAAITGRKSADVLNWVIQMFERSKGLSAGARLSLPIAITLSKSDLLRFLPVPGGYHFRFLSNPPYNGTVNVQDLYTVNDEVKAIIGHFGDRSLLSATARFDNVAYFATSATGWSPDAQGLYPSITPFRCLDPILWILWKLRIVDGL